MVAPGRNLVISQQELLFSQLYVMKINTMMLVLQENRVTQQEQSCARYTQFGGKNQDNYIKHDKSLS